MVRWKSINFKELEGITIKEATLVISDKYDDAGTIHIKTTTGRIISINGDYGGYTGKSEDEYPRRIYLSELLL